MKALHVECEKGKGEDLLEILWRWKNSILAAKQFGDNIRISEVIKPDTSPGQTEQDICMNSTGRRFQRIVEMVSLVGLVDLNRVVEVRASPTARTKKDKVPISEIILHHSTTDNKPIFLLVTKKYNLAGYGECYIKL